MRRELRFRAERFDARHAVSDKDLRVSTTPCFRTTVVLLSRMPSSWLGSFWRAREQRRPFYPNGCRDAEPPSRRFQVVAPDLLLHADEPSWADPPSTHP